MENFFLFQLLFLLVLLTRPELFMDNENVRKKNQSEEKLSIFTKKKKVTICNEKHNTLFYYDYVQRQ